jgi:hypothetical protein
MPDAVKPGGVPEFVAVVVGGRGRHVLVPGHPDLKIWRAIKSVQ